jgi:hypothetical protein
MMVVWLLGRQIVVHHHVGNRIGWWNGRDLEAMVRVADSW